MASTGIMVLHKTLLLPIPSSKCCQNQIIPLKTSQFLSSNSLSMLKKKHQFRFPSVHFEQLRNQKLPIISAAQSSFLKAILTVWKVGKDGVEAGASLVPDAVPRPLARISIAAVAGTLALFVLKSFISTAFFALVQFYTLLFILEYAKTKFNIDSKAVMGLCYFTFIALNKDEAPKGGGGETTSVDDSLEEARKIMEKYK